MKSGDRLMVHATVMQAAGDLLCVETPRGNGFITYASDATPVQSALYAREVLPDEIDEDPPQNTSVGLKLEFHFDGDADAEAFTLGFKRALQELAVCGP